MKESTLLQLNAIEGELCILGGGMRGLGLEMSTIGADPEGSNPINGLEDMGFLVQALGRYVERISVDMDAVLMEAKK